jgi:hypothetical protein
LFISKYCKFKTTRWVRILQLSLPP